MSRFVLRLNFDSVLQRSKRPEQLCRGIGYVTVKYSSKVAREDLRSPCVGALLCLLWLYPWACHQAGWGLCALLCYSLNYHKSLNFIFSWLFSLGRMTGETFFDIYSLILHLCLLSHSYSQSIIRNISEEFISFCQVSGLTLNLEQSFQSTITSVFLHAAVWELRAVLSHVHSGCFGSPMGQVDSSAWKCVTEWGYSQYVIFCIIVYMWVCPYVKAFTWFSEAIRSGMAYHDFRHRALQNERFFPSFPREPLEASSMYVGGDCS